MHRRLLSLLYLPLLVGAAIAGGLVAAEPFTADRVAILRVDGLSTLFLFLALLTVLARLTDDPIPRLRTIILALLAVTFVSADLLVVGLGGLLAAGLSFAGAPPGQRRAALPGLLAACSLLGAVTAFRYQSGIWRYDLPLSVSGLHSLVFWCILLASLILLVDFRFLRLAAAADSSETPPLPAPDLLLTLLIFYSLARLYSLGPWNLGWLLATLNAGGAIAAWSAWNALAALNPHERSAWLVRSVYGMALAGLGLGSGAGLAGAGYALLVVPLLYAGLPRARVAVAPAGSAAQLLLWTLSGAIPFTAPFVAVWMSMAAATAGGVTLLAGVIWFAALAGILSVAQYAAAARLNLRLVAAASASFLLGAATPVVMRYLLQPAVLHLQGGLTPFGDVRLWPWMGLIALNAEGRTVATVPSLALAGLMLILGALAWLVLRFVAIMRADAAAPATPEQDEQRDERPVASDAARSR